MAGDSGRESITAEGIEALHEEIAELEGPRRDEMAARIKAARELGDLKENAEYHIAKEDQAHLETRIKRLRERLRNAVVVEVDGDARHASPSAAPPRCSTKSSGEVNTWTLVGSTEADLAAGPALGRVADRPGAAGRAGRQAGRGSRPRAGRAPSSSRSSSASRARSRASGRSRSARRRAASAPRARAACRAGTTRRRGRPCSRCRRR